MQSPEREPATAEQLDEFNASLTRGWHSDFSVPSSLSSLVQLAPLVMLGELQGVEAGRKEFLFRGCANPGNDETGGACRGKPDVPIYASYVNMRVRPKQIWKGSLPDAADDVYVEHPWPNNLPTRELERTAPLGVRVLMFARLVENARELAQPLGEDGSVVPDNLLSAPPFGLVFEGVGGEAILPLLDNQEVSALLGADVMDLTTFDRLIEATSTTLPE